jgi:hypothetical protein
MGHLLLVYDESCLLAVPNLLRKARAEAIDYDKSQFSTDIFQSVADQLRGTKGPVPIVKLQRLIEVAAEKQIALTSRFLLEDVHMNRDMLLTKLVQKTRQPVTLHIQRHAADNTYSYDRRRRRLIGVLPPPWQAREPARAGGVGERGCTAPEADFKALASPTV